jgi:hypothetical protein
VLGFVSPFLPLIEPIPRNHAPAKFQRIVKRRLCDGTNQSSTITVENGRFTLIVLDGRECILQVRERPAYRSLSNDQSLDASQPRLLGTHGHDPIEARLLGFIVPADTEREVQRRFEIVARIELFFSDGISYRAGGIPAYRHQLHDTQRRLQSELHSCPIERVVDVQCDSMDDVEGIVSKWRSCLATGEVFEAEARACVVVMENTAGNCTGECRCDGLAARMAAGQFCHARTGSPQSE